MIVMIIWDANLSRYYTVQYPYIYMYIEDYLGLVYKYTYIYIFYSDLLLTISHSL
jgi:hypothetical protein